MKPKLWIAVLAVLAAGPVVGLLPLGGAPTVEARVVGVQDGDTLTVRIAEQTPVKVRLVEIDAPEKAQPYGAAAKQQLSELVHGRTVRLETQGEDRYGRTLARVYVGEQDVNKAMVRAGAAWVYADYNRDASFVPLQAQARAEKAGLWRLQDDQVVAPWDWRRGARAETASVSRRLAYTPSTSASSDAVTRIASSEFAAFQCGAKRTCRRMDSCAEAKFHLEQCSVDSLDGDGDGTPCEAICG